MIKSEYEILLYLNKIPGLDIMCLLSAWRDDLPTVLSLLKEFVRVHGYDHALLKHSMHIGDFKEVRMLVHTLRGAFGMLGVKTLYRMSSELEPLLELDSIEHSRLHSQLLNFCHELELLSAALKRFFRQY